MTTYLIVLVITFFTLLFAAGKLNKKFSFYRNDEEKFMTVLAIGFISLFWFFTVPVAAVLGFFFFVVLASMKLLK